LITFWLWLPIGWIALAVLKRRVALLEDTEVLEGLDGEPQEEAEVSRTSE